MAMKRRPNMDHSREVTPEDGGNFTKYYNPFIYKPLPDKAGEEKSNKVFFSLMAPARWSLFNPTPEMVGRYGFVGSGNQLLSVPSDLTTFSFKFPIHPVGNFRREDGTTGFTSVICPVMLNDYLMKVHGYGSLFDRPRCPYCEKSSEHWKTHNQRWEDLGYDSERKKGLGKEEYRRILESDPILKKSRDSARLYSVQDRYLTQVWDHDKFSGNRQLDEGQEGLQFQFWLAPSVVHSTLQMLYSDGIDFFDASSELGLPLIMVKKDTTKCSGNNMGQTKYTIVHGKAERYPAEWVAYLDNEEAWPDPTNNLVTLASYEEMRRTLLENSAEKEERETSPQRSFSPPQPPRTPEPARVPPAEVREPDPVPAAPMPPVQASAAPRVPTPPPVAPAPTVPSTPAPRTAAPIPTPPPSAPSMPSFGTAPIAPGMERPQAPGKRHTW